MSGYRYDFGGMVFEDMPAPSAAPRGAWYLEDILLKPSGRGARLEDMLEPSGEGEMYEDMHMLDPSRGVMEDLQGLPTYSFLELNYSSIGSSINLNASTPGTPVQLPPPVADISNPCSPREINPCTLSDEMTSVTVLEPPALEILEKTWVAEVAGPPPSDILKKAPRKRGEGKCFASGQEYKPCSWEVFIERVNERVTAGEYKVVAKRPRRQRQIRDPGATTDQVIVTRQAQAEIYGKHFNADNFWPRD